MTRHKEINFESEICEHLAADGWLYDRQKRRTALIPAAVRGKIDLRRLAESEAA